MLTVARPAVPVAAGRPSDVTAGLGALDGVAEGAVAWFRGTPSAIGTEVIAHTIHAGVDAGLPIVGILEGLAVDTTAGVTSLRGWGRVASALAAASGLVPTVAIVDGPCLGGPALVLGLVDVVIMTARATVYVNGPAASTRFTGMAGLDADLLGGAWAHQSRTGIADLVADDLDDALALCGDLLAHLPSNSGEAPPASPTVDPPDRTCRAGGVVPTDGRVSYDVRTVIADLVDDGGFLELRGRFGTSVVTAFARIAGMPVGVVANQPSQLAGALDIDGSTKGARFVRLCDSFNLPLVTLVDTPGFRPGRDQEWRGMIRHGAKLAFAYAEATVPRIAVVLRKAYGGAYIVMDCKSMGNDCAFAWPTAQIAVMGAAGAVEILHRRELESLDQIDRPQRRAQLEDEYTAVHLSATTAAERGFVDAVIDPARTRAAVSGALAALVSKRERLARRRHDNIPL